MGQWRAPWARRLTLAAALALSGLVATPAGAGAASETTNCAGLQAALDQAVSGDTITLTELCIGQDFSLNNGAHDSRSYTLQGQPGSVAGFDGTGATTSMLHAQNTAGDPTATLTLRNLVAKNAPAAPLRNGGAIAIQGDYSVTLTGDTFTDNQTGGGGSGGAVDVETQAASSTVTMSGDTFSGNQTSGGAGLGGAVNIITIGTSGTVSLDHDTFANNQTGTIGGGGAVEFITGSSSGSLGITNSTFRNNTAQDTGGALDVCECAAPLPVTLSNDVFSANQLTGACGCTLDGGAVFIDNSAGGTGALSQTGNTFSGNTITGGTADVRGGAESAVGMVLGSTNDAFTGNSIRAPVSGQVSAGAALSLENACTATQHGASNLVVAGNSIADGGAGANAQGAVHLGCGDNLTLNDATTSGNRGGGGTAGIWGQAPDQLALRNSILAGDSDGAELGFSGPGGSATATYTDLCNAGAPFGGAGNICADPLLAGASSGNVDETASSPTIDAGSNALVPGGLSTDVHGNPRIQARVAGGTPIVDMGADEFASLSPPTPGPTPGPGPGPAPGPSPGPTPPRPPRPPSNVFTWMGAVGSSADGSITVTLDLPGSGNVDVLGTQDLPRAGSARLKPGRNRFAYGRVDRGLRHGGRVRIRLKPGRNGRRMFQRNRRRG